jgi:hypothetical protein
MYARVRMGRPAVPSQALNIVLHGNSLFGGVGTLLAAALPLATIMESSVGSATFTGLGASYSLAANFSNDVDSHFDATRRNRVYVWEGLDEINDNSGTAASTHTSLASYVTTAKGFRSGAWEVWPVSIIATTEFPELQSIRDGFNTLTAADYGGGDGYANPYADSRLQDASNTTYFSADGIHLATAGKQVVADILKVIP